MTHDTPDPADRLRDAVVDACAVAVGLGLMAVNRVQAVRRQVARAADESRAERSESDPT